MFIVLGVRVGSAPPRMVHFRDVALLNFGAPARAGAEARPTPPQRGPAGMKNISKE